MTMSTSDLNELYHMIGRLESKVDGLKADREQLRDHEKRLASLERWRAWLAGGAALATILAAYAAKLFPFLK